MTSCTHCPSFASLSRNLFTLFLFHFAAYDHGGTPEGAMTTPKRQSGLLKKRRSRPNIKKTVYSHIPTNSAYVQPTTRQPPRRPQPSGPGLLPSGFAARLGTEGADRRPSSHSIHKTPRLDSSRPPPVPPLLFPASPRERAGTFPQTVKPLDTPPQRVVVESWTLEKVTAWLHTIHMHDYVALFKKHAITGKSLLSRHFDRNALHVQLGITKLGHLLTILDAVDVLRKIS